MDHKKCLNYTIIIESVFIVLLLLINNIEYFYVCLNIYSNLNMYSVTKYILKKVTSVKLRFKDRFAVHGKAVQMAQHRLLTPVLQFMRWCAAKTRSVYSSELDIHLTYHCVSLHRRYA